MFNSKKLKELECRIYKLENDLRKLRELSEIVVYKDSDLTCLSNYFWCSQKSTTITLKDIMRSVLDSIGMKLEYQEGNEASVKISKLKKKGK